MRCNWMVLAVRLNFSAPATISQVAKLALTGDRLMRSGEACRVEVGETPLRLQARESDSGLRRYQVDFPACPFTFDVLDGAILVSNEGKACSLKAADCRTDPTGLWGMGSSEFDPKKAADMLGARARVEKTVRSIFKTLYDKNAKDKATRSQLVREQAGFSSLREEICRAYVAGSGFRLLRAARDRSAGAGARRAAHEGREEAGGVETAARAAPEERQEPAPSGER